MESSKRHDAPRSAVDPASALEPSATVHHWAPRGQADAAHAPADGHRPGPDRAPELDDSLARVRRNLAALGEYRAQFERVLDAYKALADGIRSGGSDMLPTLLDAVDAVAAQSDLDFIVGDAAELIEDSNGTVERIAAIIGGERDRTPQ
jgi:hypothetical protein